LSWGHVGKKGRPMVWETREVRGETNQSRFASSFTFFPCCLLTTKYVRTHATHSTRCSSITLTLTPSCWHLLPKAHPSVRVYDSTGTRRRLAGIPCDESVGVPRHRLPQPDTSICCWGQRRWKHPTRGRMAQHVFS